MTKSDSIALIVPCYNEVDRILVKTFSDYLDNHPKINFLFVDDGSSDGTLSMLSKFCGDKGEQARVISLEVNSGKAEAVRQGVLQVIDGDYEYIGYWDADLSTPLDEIDNLLSSLKKSNADAALGSRVMILGHEIDRHLYRFLAGRIFATLASNTLNLPVYDTQCGAKIFSNNRYFKAIFADPFISDWSFDVEMLMRYSLLYRAADADINILEVPLGRWTDIAGSKVGALDFFYSIYDLYRIRFHYRRKRVIDHYRQLLLSY